MKKNALKSGSQAAGVFKLKHLMNGKRYQS